MSSKKSYRLNFGNRKRPVSKKKFTPEEDQELTRLVGIHGENWELIIEYMPGRNVRQVRDRWNCYVSPAINKGPFTREEDALLVEKVEELGPKWVKMTEFFNGRSDTALKNRWQILERRMRQGIQIIKDSPYITDAFGNKVSLCLATPIDVKK